MRWVVGVGCFFRKLILKVERIIFGLTEFFRVLGSIFNKGSTLFLEDEAVEGLFR